MAIQAGIAAVGIGMQAFGTMKSSQAAKQSANISMQNANLEMQVQAQHKQAMELQSRRMQMENIRNTQLARSMSLNAATGQGAQFGSGYAGGIGQISGQSGVNALGISQNLEIGENIYGLDNQISQNKMKMAQIGGQQATYQGISSLGGSITGAAGGIGRMSQGFGGSSYGRSSPMGTYGGQISSMGRGGIY